MQIVIDIPENTYNLITRGDENRDFVYKSDLMHAINNGTPLPPGHGRLIDEKNVMKIYDSDARVWWENALDDIKEFVPTIIEADKENDNA